MAMSTTMLDRKEIEFHKYEVFVEYFNEEKSTCLTVHRSFGLRTYYRTL
jgi:hypothetical protein